MEQNGLRLLGAKIENFKNIDQMEVDFGGRSAIIVGPNGIGKSSFIQALISPIDAKYMPAEPIKKGEERGKIELSIGGVLHGEKKDYTIECFFSPAKKKGRLKLLDATGQELTPAKSMLDSIIGNIGFDILEFINLGITKTGKVSEEGVRKQIEALKKLLPHEIRVELDKINSDIKEKKNQKTILNSNIKTSQSFIENSDFTQEEIAKYSEPINLEAIMKKVNEVNEEIQKYDKVKNFYETCKNKIPQIESECKQLEEEIKQLETQIKNKRDIREKKMLEKRNIEQQQKQANLWLQDKNKPSIELVTQELNEAQEHNRNVLEIGKYSSKYEELRKDQDELEAINKDQKKLEGKKKKILSNNALPIPGLSFDEERIYYKDLPFTAEQHPTSEIISIGMMIAMAMNPNLRLIIINDGSLLDNDTLEQVLKMSNEYGYQVLIEKVRPEGGDLEVEFVENEC